MKDDPEHPEPLDPDWADVPPALAALDGKQVSMTEPDGTTVTGVLVIAPGLWGHARRLREGQ